MLGSVGRGLAVMTANAGRGILESMLARGSSVLGRFAAVKMPSAGNLAPSAFNQVAPKTLDPVVNALNGVGGKGGAPAIPELTPKHFPEVSAQISIQKQLRHVGGDPLLGTGQGGSYMHSVADAQKVLDAYRAGQTTILGKNPQGFPVVRFDGVTGINVNSKVGITNQPTNVFLIKGTKSPSIIQTNPNWSPK